MTVEEWLAHVEKKRGRPKRRLTPAPMVPLLSCVDRQTGFQKLAAPIRIESLLNVRYGHMQMHRAKKRQETDLRILLQSQLDVELARTTLPLTIVLWRIAPNKLDQGNLQAAHKATQDAVARWIGIDDGDTDAYDWKYDQRPDGKLIGFEVVIRPWRRSDQFEDIDAHIERMKQNRARWDKTIHEALHPQLRHPDTRAARGAKTRRR